MIIEKPKIRPVEAFPAEYEGRTLVALRDPQGYAEDMVLVPHEVLAILEYFDGQHTVQEIQQAYMRQNGELLYSDLLERLIEQLDQHHLLDSPTFTTFKREVEETFRKSSVRPCFHAGAAYEDDPEALHQQLDSVFDLPGAPGRPDFSRHNGPMIGLVAPHIDLHRGGKGYAQAYKALAESEPADLYIILGVAHAGSESPFILTQKDFQTPLGLVETDREFVSRLQQQSSQDFFADEISHKTEHSIEFQVIFLQHLLGNSKKFKIVPILIGSFHEMIYGDQLPEQVPQVKEFVQILADTLKEAKAKGQKVCVIAGVDLAHVGHRFGDKEELSPSFLDHVKEEDQRFLKHVLERNADSLFRMIQQEKDWRKVCGYPALYVFLKILPECTAELLDYEQWADPPSGCSVSFASLTFR